MKSTKFVGTHILAKAKVSIINFTYDVFDTFDDPIKNPTVAEDMKEMGLTKVIPSVILIDTDSVYLNFLGIYNCANPKVTEDYFQRWVRESIIYCNRTKVDTSNLENTPYKTRENYKKLNMFQFLTSTPNYKQIVAVNPKEYYCMFGDNSKPLNKHKGIPDKIKLDYDVYSNRVRSFEFLQNNEQALKSESVTYAQMVRQRNKVFIKDTMSKVKIGRLSDKMYVFSNGITTLPHSHYLLKPIYDAGVGKTTEYLQSDEHIQKILEIEKELEQKHDKLRYMGMYTQNIFTFIFTQNEHIYL